MIGRWRVAVLTISSVVLAALVMAGQPGRTAAESRAEGAWKQVGPEGRVHRLYAPSTGVVFANVANELYRSDDAGESWRPVHLPPPKRPPAPPPAFTTGKREIAVDPTNHRVI